jgi:hypothetical protein
LSVAKKARPLFTRDGLSLTRMLGDMVIRRPLMSAQDSPGGGGTSTLESELEELLRDEQLEDGDHERFSHYVRKEDIVESAVTGKPVYALCGKKWTPNRAPEKFPVCPTCKEIYEGLRDE